MDEERFVDIESKLAHQEILLEKLNEVLTNQQVRLTQVEELCGRLVERVQAIGEASSDAAADHEPPPHY